MYCIAAAAAKQMAVWMGFLPSLSASGLITRPVLVFGLLAYRYGFAACASVAKLKVEAPRPWADRSVNFHTCNPQHCPGKDTDGGRRTTDDDGGALGRSLTLTCGDTEA